MNKKINCAVKNKRKNLSELGFSDNFIFTKVMEDKSICLEIVSTLLEIEISDLEYLETEKTLDVAFNSKATRFDCLVKSENKIINIEMQVNEKNDLVFRARYYHIIIGMDNLGVGEDYISLSDTYVIFICKFDPFNKGDVKYEFESYCKKHDIYENNKEHTLYFNTSAKDILKEGKLKELLKLVEGIPSEDEFSLKLQRKIDEIKNNVKWQRDYMKFSADLMDERREGKAEGIIEGKAQGIIEGEAKGKAKGIIEGKAEGVLENRLENAKGLLDILSDEVIAEKIGLDIEVVKELRQKNI